MITRKKPYSGEELFDAITKIIKEKGLYPEDVIDYRLPAYGAKDLLIKNEEFDINGVTMYGVNEGFYVDIVLRGRLFPGGQATIGVIKTLMTDEETIYKMGKLAVDYVIQGSDFIEKNLDDFNWLGYDIYVDGKATMTCGSLEWARIRAEKYRKKSNDVKLFDNEKKKFVA